MPPRRGKREAKAAPASEFKITSLDENSLQHIFSFVEYEKRNFACAHPVFMKAYREIVTEAYVLEDVPFDQMSKVLNRYPNLTTIRVKTFHVPASTLYDLKGPSSITNMWLGMVADVPGRRPLSALGMNFPNLRLLSLNCRPESMMYTGRKIDSKGPFLNSDGGLRVLSSLRNLEELDLRHLYSDDGIQHLTSLTKLTISFPELRTDYPSELYCHGCESIHLDDDSDLQTYTRSIPWAGLGITFGKSIGRLPKLKYFSVDFDAPEGSLSYSGILNRLYLREPAHAAAGTSKKTSKYNSLSDNIHSPPREPRYFQCLEEIEFLNCGGPEHFLYTPTMHRRIQYPSEGLACNDFWHTCVIWECMKNFPKLRKWRLHAFDGGLDEGVEPLDVNWPCACGCGTVKGQVVEKCSECGCTKTTFVEIDRPAEL